MTNNPDSHCLFKRIEEQELTAKQYGFYWERIDQLLDQIKSECEEVEESWKKNDRAHLQEEVGDLLNAAVSLAIFCNLIRAKLCTKAPKSFKDGMMTL